MAQSKKDQTFDTNQPFDIKGIGPKKEQLLHEYGIANVTDLALALPRSYRDQTLAMTVEELEDGMKAVLTVQITRVNRTVYLPGRRTIAKAEAEDETGTIKLVWFNQPYVTKNLRVGDSYSLYGAFDASKNALQNPIVQPLSKGSLVGIEPIYPRIKGISNKDRKRFALASLDRVDWKTYECFSKDEREEMDLLDLATTYRAMHAPTSFAELERANRSLQLRHYTVRALSLSTMKRTWMRSHGPVLDRFDEQALSALPFTMTRDQKIAFDEIREDLRATRPMNRLLQGDVGSGKTAVASMALVACVQSGYQGAMMAPTESLARQHYEKLSAIFEKLGIRTRLLVGSTGQEERNAIDAGLANQTIDVLIGTHTLFQDRVDFHSLGLVVTDEQHRFGVMQRQKFGEKGDEVNVLVLSATPIPRTLSLVMHGDLDVSRIVEKPPGRKKIETFVVDTRYEERYLRFIEREVAAGRQCFIVCPRIDDDGDAPWSLESLYTYLHKGPLASLRLGKLHGRMKPEKKAQMLSAFYAGKIDVLLSTTVIEVGIDVPNASVMCIYGAEHFGLAQLHQLRGRVGRSDFTSYCILVCTTPKKASFSRLHILVETEDGYEIAKQDLLLRGEGDRYGTEQSGSADDFLREVDPRWVEEVEHIVEKYYPNVERLMDLPQPMRDCVEKDQGQLHEVLRN